ncbi:nucleocapsid [Buffalo Creek virus]|uniref:Nucleoprotein n=1 Tax=Buffalo Creek virus TaxID=1590834 RepID=A0A0B4ZS52_9VIRU|nr:nucleocapsid [Buffalo Creek virus]AJD77608.1 nucleocapsid [Buffalo Creek virus]
MADIDFVFDDTTSVVSDFDPKAGYEYFISNYTSELNLGSLNTFFKNVAKAKAQLRMKSKRQVTMKFGDLEVVIHNNNYPGYQNNELSTADLTLHRLSAYLIKYAADEVKEAMRANNRAQAAVWKGLILPLSLSHGVTWEHGYVLYMSFTPGAEMFMDTFMFYPVAIGIYRAKQDPEQAQYLKKALRQRYAGQKAEVWMVKHQKDVQAAVEEVAKLPWTKSSMSEAARQFLAKFGIKI